MADIHIELGEGYLITSDKALLQPREIHRYLNEESYWAQGIPYDLVERSFQNSWTVGVLHNGKQIAYARLITDYAVFAYLADVYVLEAHRGKGLSKKMMEVIMGLPFVQGARGAMLATRDAHSLYAQYGFAPLSSPDRYMAISRPDLYTRSEKQA